MPKVTILPDGKTVEVPRGTSLLAASQRVGALHGGACGGACACSGCHVVVQVGFDSLSEPTDRELDGLDKAFGVGPRSRLGCQARVGDEDVTFEISPESLQSWLDEHPAQRKDLERGLLPADASPALVERLAKHASR